MGFLGAGGGGRLGSFAQGLQGQGGLPLEDPFASPLLINPEPPEETLQRIGRPTGLARDQLIARGLGISQLGNTTSGLNIPDF